MKKLIMVRGVVLILVILLSINIVFSYVPIEKYKGISIKYYNDAYKKECEGIIDQIPSEYFEDLYYIHVQPKSRTQGGLYWWYSQGIVLFNGCNKEVLIHELAHHCQYKKGDTLHQGKKHSNNFKECYEEIWESSKQ